MFSWNSSESRRLSINKYHVIRYTETETEVMTRSTSVGGGKQDIAGKATMTITLNWNATSTSTNAMVILTASTTIYIWAPTACKLSYILSPLSIALHQLNVRKTAEPHFHKFYQIVELSFIRYSF